jgi:hypothetical protein
MSLLFVKTNKKMMTRSKTINAANAVANATNATNTATVVANADAPIVYPSMFDRWRLPL